MWHYVMFIDYLKQKNRKCPESVSIEEMYILKIIMKRDQEQKWFPCYFKEDDLKIIQDKIHELDNGMAERVTKVEDKVDKLLDILNDINTNTKPKEGSYGV